MARGGARPGSGPKPTVRNQATARLIQEAADDGVLPLKMLLDSLRFYSRQVDELLAKLLTEGAPPVEKAEGEDEPHADIIEALKQALGIRKRMEEVAAMALPYCHPRQGNAIENERANDFVPLAERIAQYQRDADLALAGGKVVEFKPGT